MVRSNAFSLVIGLCIIFALFLLRAGACSGVDNRSVLCLVRRKLYTFLRIS